jgi:hypothetical protein
MASAAATGVVAVDGGKFPPTGVPRSCTSTQERPGPEGGAVCFPHNALPLPDHFATLTDRWTEGRVLGGDGSHRVLRHHDQGRAQDQLMSGIGQHGGTT